MTNNNDPLADAVDAIFNPSASEMQARIEANRDIIKDKLTNPKAMVEAMMNLTKGMFKHNPDDWIGEGAIIEEPDGDFTAVIKLDPEKVKALMDRIAITPDILSDALRLAERYGGMLDYETLSRHLMVSRWEAQRILGKLCDEGKMFYAWEGEMRSSGIYHLGYKV